MIYIYTAQISNGIRVIINQVIESLGKKGFESKMVMSLEEVSSTDIIIPYGIKESIELAKTKRPLFLSLLVDAVSLGYKNKIVHYLKHFHVFNYDFLYSIYGYLRYAVYDKKVSNLYETLMLVSDVDIAYLKKINPDYKTRFICVRNGTILPSSKIVKREFIPKSHLKLGLLASWGNIQTYEEANWFVRNYFRRYYKSHPEVSLVIAGRGKYIKRFEGEPGVRIIGEVEQLQDFFSQIDLFITTNPKGCGVLNRILDAMSYCVPVLGNIESFSGLPNYDMVANSFDSYDNFVNEIEYICSNPAIINLKLSKYPEYLSEYFDWSKNYHDIIEEIIQYLESHSNVDTKK